MCGCPLGGRGGVQILLSWVRRHLSVLPPVPFDSVLGSRRKEEENEQGDQGGGRGHDGGGGEGLVRVGPNEKWAGTYGMPDAGTDRLGRAGGVEGKSVREVSANCECSFSGCNTCMHGAG